MGKTRKRKENDRNCIWSMWMGWMIKNETETRTRKNWVFKTEKNSKLNKFAICYWTKRIGQLILIVFISFVESRQFLASPYPIFGRHELNVAISCRSTNDVIRNRFNVVQWKFSCAIWSDCPFRIWQRNSRKSNDKTNIR